jgi:hypothetical protein
MASSRRKHARLEVGESLARLCECTKQYKAVENKVLWAPGHSYLTQLQEKAMDCKLYYDADLRIGSPPVHLSASKDRIEYSSFVLQITIVETPWIENLMSFTHLTFSALHLPHASSGLVITRDDTSIYIRMACQPSYCQVCGKCKNCLTKLPVVNDFVKELGYVACSVYSRQDKKFEGKSRVPHPKTPPSAFAELLQRVLRGFHKGGIHDLSAQRPRSGNLHNTGHQNVLLASTSESMPYIGCIYNIGTRSIESLPYRMPSKPAPRCGICLEPLSQVALMKMPCNCLRCLDCLAESFKLALSARHNFPPKCCGEKLNIHKFSEHLTTELVNRFMVVADEYQSENFTYCADPKCSSFIKPTLIDDNIGMCPECFKRTCFSCQKLELVHHYWPDRQCPNAEDEEQAKLKDLAGEKEWKACPRCRAIVERSDGCNHMKCHCQQKFCYQCGISYEGDEPPCKCGLGLNYLQEQVDAEADEEEDLEEEQAPDEADDEEDAEEVSDEEDEEEEEEEDEIDALHRQQLQQAGIQLARGDLTRIRSLEIQLGEQGQQLLAREREKIRASVQVQALPKLPRNPATEQLRQIEENRRRRFQEAGLVYQEEENQCMFKVRYK